MRRVLLVVVLLVPVPSYSQNAGMGKRTVGSNPPNKQSESVAQQPQPDTRGTENSPLIVHEDDSPRSETEARRNQEKEDTEVSQRSINQSLAVIVAIAALIQALVLVMQWCLFRRQTRIMNGSLIQMSRTAKAARDSADDARETARFTQCADVLIEVIEMINADPLRLDSAVAIHFKNFGPTRASNVIFDFHLTAGTFLNASNLVDPVILGSTESKPLVFKKFGNLGVLATDIPTISSGVAPLKFQGTVSYDDVFGTRHTIACEGTFDAPTKSFRAKQTIVKT